MTLAQRWSRIAVFIALTTVMTMGVRLVRAQAPDKSGKTAEPVLDTVSAASLSRNLDRLVTVHGIIGDYHGDKSHYNLHTDDNSNVEVIGAYPEVAHVRYTLHARVARDNGHYILQEISKERVYAESGASRDPLLIAGIALILAAVITLVVMVSRNRSAQHRMVMEQQIEEERRRTEAARADAERARKQAERYQKSDGPGATVAAGGGASARNGTKAKPAHTLISIGSIEVVSGPHMGMKFPLQHGETRIGRSSDTGCEIVLDQDHEVSGYHGSLIATIDGKLMYKDQSSNGSILDGKTVHHGQAETASGGQLNVGSSTLRFTLRGGSSSQGAAVVEVPTGTPAVAPPAVAIPVASTALPGAPSPDNAAPRPAVILPPRSAPTVAVQMPFASPKRPSAPTHAGFGAELAVLSGTASGQRFPISRPVTTIGREDRDILLEEDTVSRRHATLTVQAGAFVLTDDGSTHGTRVNGDPVKAEGRILQDGDLVALGSGDVALIFHKVGV